jgi:hypothetical protein
MNSGASRILGVLAVALLIPACNLTLTTSEPVGTPPPQSPFLLELPLAGQTGVWPTNTEFTWDPRAGATTYTLELSRTSDFSSPLYIRANIPVTWLFLTVNLTHSTTYYWRVSTVVGGITEYAAGSPSSFTTVPSLYSPPDPFVLLSPLGATLSPASELMFTWEYAEQATSYTFEIDTTDQFSNPVVKLQDLRLNRATVTTPLAQNVTYFWRVTALNSGSRTCSPAWSWFAIKP